MSITHEEYRGGGLAKSLTAETHQLIPSERWNLFSTSGACILKLPNANGLPLGTVFHVSFTTSSGTVALHNYSTGAAQTVYDINGVARTSIDHTTPNWSSRAAFEARLLNNATADGVWLCYSWSSA